ncbi:MAG: HNH endonuclease [Methylococcales bacterium]
MEYNLKEWNEVVIEITPSGKAPKKYGEGVYRFSASLTLSVIMPRRKWELVKKTKNYVYLKPPTKLEGPPFNISIKIPCKAQAVEIANTCFNKGESWMGQIGEWPAWYFHEQPQKTYEILPNEDRTGIIKKLHYEDHLKSSLNIGEFGVWSVKLIKTDGDFSYHEYGSVKLDGGRASSQLPLLEGSEFSVEQTIHERNPVARQECIDHFGAMCQVCYFDISKSYGPIGIGFIHVHHLAPISKSNGEYNIDPEKDLIPLCPNCHAMIHRVNPPYTVGELKEIYQVNNK